MSLRPLDSINITILSKPADVSGYVDLVRTRADTLRHELGFLPRGAYREMAEQGKLLIALVEGGRDKTYAGHLLFGGTFPHGRVFQTYVEPQFHRLGVGRRLVQTLVKHAHKQHYLTLRARVASDLSAANEFYERMGFRYAQLTRGGKRRGRAINIRVRQLHTPSLFNWSAIQETAGEPFRLAVDAYSSTVRYAIDLNVLFDAVRKRTQSELVGRVVKTGLNNVVKIAVTRELIVELERHSQSGSPDPILEFARQLPQVSAPPEDELNAIVNKLGPIVFPREWSAGQLREQDRSDLIHLATAIYHRIAGFITSEKKILGASSQLRSDFGINVVGPSEFLAAAEPAPASIERKLAANDSTGTLSISQIDDDHDRPNVVNFLSEIAVPAEQQAKVLFAGTSGAPNYRFAARSDEQIVAVCNYSTPSRLKPQAEMVICADQENPAAAAAIDHLIDRACRDACRAGPALIRLNQISGHVLTREIAGGHGFHTIGENSDVFGPLQKGCIGAVINRRNWKTLAQDIKNRLALHLPEHPPFQEVLTQPWRIVIGSRASNVPVTQLETMLSPVLFVIPGRDGAIIPIWRDFSDLLAPGGDQPSLLAMKEASLFRERTYVSSSQASRVITPGMPIIFYESTKHKGRAAAVAVARAVRCEILVREQLPKEVGRRAVLDEMTIQKVAKRSEHLAITFDNIFRFAQPVSLNRLKRLGCVDSLNLVTARPLTDAQVEAIVNEGQPSV
jgi:GNAT superfamily N-acetyltransferase